MAKNFDANKLIAVTKKNEADNNIDSIVKRIHETTATEKEKEATARVVIFKELFKRIKLRALEKEVSFKDYILTLVEKDLNQQ